MSSHEHELLACESKPVYMTGMNPDAVLPYGLTADIVFQAMNDFVEFLTFVNSSLNAKGIVRLENLIMPANFSSLVGEFMIQRIAAHSKTLVQNRHHNGHPDLLPVGRYPNDKAQHELDGIEVKASRNLSGWQGHNAEDVWLMVFVFENNSQSEVDKPPIPFRFLKVIGAQLTKSDWKFAGRSETSRRTITASITESGRRKMEANWVYCVPELRSKLRSLPASE